MGCGGRLGLVFCVCYLALTPAVCKILIIISQWRLKPMCAVLWSPFGRAIGLNLEDMAFEPTCS